MYRWIVTFTYKDEEGIAHLKKAEVLGKDTYDVIEQTFDLSSNLYHSYKVDIVSMIKLNKEW